MAVRSYGPDPDFGYVGTVTLEIWPWVKVMTHPLVMDNKCVKYYPDQTRGYEVMARTRCEKTDGPTGRQGYSFITPPPQKKICLQGVPLQKKVSTCTSKMYHTVYITPTWFVSDIIISQTYYVHSTFKFALIYPPKLLVSTFVSILHYKYDDIKTIENNRQVSMCTTSSPSWPLSTV